MVHHRWIVRKAQCPNHKAIARRVNENPERPWFNDYVVPGLTKTHMPEQNKPINYRTCLNEMKMALSLIQTPVVDAKHYTHIERKTAPGMAEIQGLEIEQIRRAGRWRAAGALLESYLTGIPYDFCRHTAGFGGKGSVFIVRAEFDPPPTLIKQVFPFIAKLKVEQAKSDARRRWPWCPESSQFITLMDHLAVAVLSLAVGWLFFMKRYKAAQLTATLATTLVVTPLSELPWSDLRIGLGGTVTRR